MEWPPQNTGLFAVPQCIACCATPSKLCNLVMPTPCQKTGASFKFTTAFFGEAFESEEVAKQMLTDFAKSGFAFVTGGYYPVPPNSPPTSTIDNTTADTVVLSALCPGSSGWGSTRFEGWMKVETLDGAVLTYDATRTGTNSILVYLFDEDCQWIESKTLSNANSNHESSTTLAAGTYTIGFLAFANAFDNDIEVEITVASSETMAVLPVAAAFLDEFGSVGYVGPKFIKVAPDQTSHADAVTALDDADVTLTTSGGPVTIDYYVGAGSVSATAPAGGGEVTDSTDITISSIGPDTTSVEIGWVVTDNDNPTLSNAIAVFLNGDLVLSQGPTDNNTAFDLDPGESKTVSVVAHAVASGSTDGNLALDLTARYHNSHLGTEGDAGRPVVAVVEYDDGSGLECRSYVSQQATEAPLGG